MRALSSVSDGPDASPEGWLWTVLPEAQEVTVVSAYLTFAGLELVQAPLTAALVSGAQVLVVTGGRRDQVDVRALEALLVLERSFPGQMQTFIVPAGSHMLTAKSYGVQARSGAVHAWLGSANLTRAGLTRNFQTGVVFSGDHPDQADHRAASKIIADAHLWREAPEATQLTTEVQRTLRLTEPGELQDAGEALEDVIDYLEGSVAHRARPAPQTSTSTSGAQSQQTAPSPTDGTPGGADPASSSPTPSSAGANPGLTAAPPFPTPTGFQDLDNLLGGLHQGQLTLIAGETGVGKSVLARDFARFATLKADVPTLLLSTQTSTREAMQAIVAAEARIPRQKLARVTMDDRDWTRFARAVETINKAPLSFSHQGRYTIEDIRRWIRQTAQQRGRPVGLVVVDSIASLATDPSRRFSGREQEIAYLAVSLKALAVEEEVAVVVTSGLTRGQQQRSDKRPILADVRDSTQVVESADVAILIHREDMHWKESERAGEADLIVAKSRNSPTDTVTVAFQGHYSRFVDMAL